MTNTFEAAGKQNCDAWRKVASAELVSLADRAYMKKFLFGRNHLKIMLPTTD